MTESTTAAALVARYEGAVARVSHGQDVVHLDRAHLGEAVAYLRDEQQYSMLVDVTSVDHLRDVERLEVDGVTAERFEVVVNLISHPRNERIRLICAVPEDDATVPSLTSIWLPP